MRCCTAAHGLQLCVPKFPLTTILMTPCALLCTACTIAWPLALCCTGYCSMLSWHCVLFLYGRQYTVMTLCAVLCTADGTLLTLCVVVHCMIHSWHCVLFVYYRHMTWFLLRRLWQRKGANGLAGGDLVTALGENKQGRNNWNKQYLAEL